MTTPLDITFRHMNASPVLDHEIRARAAWLETYHPYIQGCRVVLEVPHRHHRHGRNIWVAVEVALPDGPVHVHHCHEPSRALSLGAGSNGGVASMHHREAVEAIREAFHAARRRVVGVLERHRGE